MKGFKFGKCSRTCGLKLFGSSGVLCDELRAASNRAWTVPVVDYPQIPLQRRDRCAGFRLQLRSSRDGQQSRQKLKDPLKRLGVAENTGQHKRTFDKNDGFLGPKSRNA